MSNKEFIEANYSEFTGNFKKIKRLDKNDETICKFKNLDILSP